MVKPGVSTFLFSGSGTHSSLPAYVQYSRLSALLSTRTRSRKKREEAIGNGQQEVRCYNYCSSISGCKEVRLQKKKIQGRVGTFFVAQRAQRVDGVGLRSTCQPASVPPPHSLLLPLALNSTLVLSFSSF